MDISVHDAALLMEGSSRAGKKALDGSWAMSA